MNLFQKFETLACFAPGDDRVVAAAIYPPLGVARIGNSQEPDGYFIGPETADEPILPRESYEDSKGVMHWKSNYRDKHGALKRQAARFRVYGLNANGEAVVELNATNAEVSWSAHLVNQKSSWYQFQLALDIPEASSASPTMLRNGTVSDRKSLTVDPDPRSIQGASAAAVPFDTGEFVGKKVCLGELRTDDKGRLLVLGGHGVSASYDGSTAVTFANNEKWHDDTADGPVTATVTYNGVALDVKPAWVIVGPPNYAPRQKSVRTMWDLMRDTAIKAKQLPQPARPSFNADIRPIFERMSDLQWVNKGFAAAFGFGGWANLATPEWLERLSNPTPVDQALRQTIANNFRVQERDGWAPQPFPWVYGDAMDIPHTPRANASLTDTQLAFLQQWAKGDFVSDYKPGPGPTELDHVPVAEQPDMLTRAAMDFCLADAFHPGCELTWPMRHDTMYSEAFRIDHAPPGWVEPSYGPVLTIEALNSPVGPLRRQVPGGLTRWMAIPWQTDTASCRCGYDTKYDPHVPTFWPARVPNHALTEDDYRIVIDTNRTDEDRRAAFSARACWDSTLAGDDYLEQINDMIAHFGKMGVVEYLPGPTDGKFPPMQVEGFPEAPASLLTSARADRSAQSRQSRNSTEWADQAAAMVRRFGRSR